MLDTSDPYRNTIKRTLEDKKNKERRENFIKKEKTNTSKAFLDQSVELPDSINNILGFGIFAFIPYMVGFIFIFLIIAQANIEIYKKTDMNSFLLAWTIGYELIATIVLLAIFKSALNFKKKNY